jgi:hypothetical protein
MRWLAKAAVQNTAAVVPGGRRFNRVLQRYGTGSVVMTPAKVVEKLSRVCARHVDHHARFGARPLGDATVVEVGTGFAPLLPVGLFLAGSGPVHTLDIVELADARATHELLGHVVTAAERGTLAPACPWVLPERLARVRELAAAPAPVEVRALLHEMGIVYAVGDAARSGLVPGTVDLFVTNNVFEHVPPPVIADLLGEAHRTGAAGAIASHHIDLRDHYARFDRGVGVYNSLRFTANQWRVLDNRMEPQNRLRHSDYLRLIDEAGFDVVADDSHAGPERDFARVRGRIAPDFSGYAEPDLRIVDMWVAARRRA